MFRDRMGVKSCEDVLNFDLFIILGLLSFLVTFRVMKHSIDTMRTLNWSIITVQVCTTVV